MNRSYEVGEIMVFLSLLNKRVRVTKNQKRKNQGGGIDLERNNRSN